MGVRVAVYSPHMDRLCRPVGLCDHTLRVDLDRYRVGLDCLAVDPNGAHHFEPCQVGIMEQYDTHVCVQVLAYRPDQFRDDLGERFSSRQGRAHRVEALEVESLRLELSLLAHRNDCLFLELEADECRRRGDDHHGEEGHQHIGDRVGLAEVERDEGDGGADRHGHERVCPPGQKQT